ncbi:MAG: DUF58 domain-containing protein [Bdellovibrionaceae bacterium]|nr:DUF58 domain-containing protein [Pseudobdellovibrionaceae bacterium]
MNFSAKFQFLRNRLPSRRFVERHQKTYILPTLYGVAFGFVCILILGIAFASTNNAVYFLCFLLTVLGVQSLVTTNKNTERFDISRIEVEDFFADETGFARIYLHNQSAEDLHQVSLETASASKIEVLVLRSHERKEIQMPIAIAKPGLHQFPPVKVSSDFPFYFARSWKKHYGDLKFAVFPSRRGQIEFPAEAFADIHLQQLNQDEFKSHREYETSDSPRRIDWKVTARLDKMMVKEYDQQTTTKVTLRWEDCPQSNPDDKKSQLSLWIDLAEKKNFEYAVILPGFHIEFGKGPQHRLNCLRSLL